MTDNTASLTEALWARFRNHTATESDLRAIWDGNEAELAANPKLKRCPEFDEYMRKWLWQIERMDWINGKAPTLADVLAVFAALESESAQ